MAKTHLIETRQILIDTDPGVDDALALILLLLSSKIHLLGISSIYGNHSVSQTTQNILNILSFVKKNSPANLHLPPVSQGSHKPLKRKFTPFLGIHGKHGLGHLKIPSSKLSPTKIPAADFIQQQLLTTKNKTKSKTTLLCLGPLTNIAKFIKLHSQSVRLIDQVIIMGGAINHPGNYDYLIETNFGRDPEAASLVFSTFTDKIILFPLNITEKFQLTNKIINQITPLSSRKFIKLLTQEYNQFYQNRRRPTFLRSPFIITKFLSGAIHDAVAASYCLLDKNHFTHKSINISISTTKRPGQVLSSFLNLHRSSSKIKVITAISHQPFWSLLTQSLSQIKL